MKMDKKRIIENNKIRFTFFEEIRYTITVIFMAV